LKFGFCRPKEDFCYTRQTEIKFYEKKIIVMVIEELPSESSRRALSKASSIIFLLA
jgi:hypothetical protein